MILRPNSTLEKVIRTLAIVLYRQDVELMAVPTDETLQLCGYWKAAQDCYTEMQSIDESRRA